MIARACGKANVHDLDPDDLRALTIEAAAITRIPLVGTHWVPGQSGADSTGGHRGRVIPAGLPDLRAARCL